MYGHNCLALLKFHSNQVWCHLHRKRTRILSLHVPSLIWRRWNNKGSLHCAHTYLHWLYWLQLITVKIWLIFIFKLTNLHVNYGEYCPRTIRCPILIYALHHKLTLGSFENTFMVGKGDRNITRVNMVSILTMVSKVIIMAIEITLWWPCWPE